MDKENKFSADKISIRATRIYNWELKTPQNFKYDLIEGHNIETSFKTGFNVENKTAKADIEIKIRTRSKEKQEESSCFFDISMFYEIKNFDDLINQKDEGGLEVDFELLSAIASITYSTTRGILITRLQGTSMASFIMPIIEPQQLLKLE